MVASVISAATGIGTAQPGSAGTSARGKTGEASQRVKKEELTPSEQRQVEKLKQIDQAVHNHEAAHMAAGGSLITSGPTYSYTYGPDGKQYAVGGEVGIDVSATGKAEQDIAKGRRVQAAALAPADPSSQDYAVASAGQQLVTQGQAELAAQRRQQQVAKSYGAADQRGTHSLSASA